MTWNEILTRLAYGADMVLPELGMLLLITLVIVGTVFLALGVPMYFAEHQVARPIRYTYCALLVVLGLLALFWVFGASAPS